MTAEQISGWVLLLLMSILACVGVAFISGKKYEGRGIYFITINALIRGNKDYLRWIKNNTIYFWVAGMVVVLCPTILTLAPSFRSGNMILRPEIMIWLNPFLWFFMLMALRWFFNKLQTYNNYK
jgi:hypothetical protein